MQIFELTQPITELNWGDATKALSKSILQAPVKALGQKVGAELAPKDDTKTISQQVADTQRFFNTAYEMFKHNEDEDVIRSRLMNKYGATKQQANQAIDSMLDHVEQQQQTAKGMTSWQAQQPVAAVAPAPTVAPAPAVPPTPEQQRIARQKAAGAAAQAQMAANQKPPPVNYGTGVGPSVKPQMTATPTVTPPTYAAPQSKPSNVVQLRPPMPPTAKNDILQALAKLGYKPREAEAAVRQLPPNISTQDAIKQILRGTPATQAMVESLSWSRSFDPSATLLNKIKKS